MELLFSKIAFSNGALLLANTGTSNQMPHRITSSSESHIQQARKSDAEEAMSLARMRALGAHWRASRKRAREGLGASCPPVFRRHLLALCLSRGAQSGGGWWGVVRQGRKLPPMLPRWTAAGAAGLNSQASALALAMPAML